MSGQCIVCHRQDSEYWGSENGFEAVRCSNCGLVYLDPWPDMTERDKALEYGAHQGDKLLRTNCRYRHSAVSEYAITMDKVFGVEYFPGRKVSWLDIGCGYGEFLETLRAKVAPGSMLKGSEPNRVKRDSAQTRGLDVDFYDLDQLDQTYTHISLLNVFSHLPGPIEFLKSAVRHLRPGGEVLLQTGNGGDIEKQDFPGELFLPDHLIFGGRKSLDLVIREAGLETVAVNEFRTPKLTPMNLMKDVVKRVVREDHNPVSWSGPYRDMWIRARKPA